MLELAKLGSVGIFVVLCCKPKHRRPKALGPVAIGNVLTQCSHNALKIGLTVPDNTREPASCSPFTPSFEVAIHHRAGVTWINQNEGTVLRQVPELRVWKVGNNWRERLEYTLVKHEAPWKVSSANDQFGPYELGSLTCAKRQTQNIALRGL
jgi:hypothetical protein